MHPLQKVITESEGFLLIGDSAADRFPGFSYNAYTKLGKRFYCLDLGGLRESRGPTKGGPVYSSVAELPEDRDAVAHARSLGMSVVEIGRCPVYYLDGAPAGCAAHTALTRLSGTWKRAPQVDSEASRREIW